MNERSYITYTSLLLDMLDENETRELRKLLKEKSDCFDDVGREHIKTEDSRSRKFGKFGKFGKLKNYFDWFRSLFW